jgi:FkbM family methyltransferase
MRAFVIEIPVAYCDGKERTIKICFEGTSLCLTGGEFRFSHTAQFKPIHTFVDPDPSIAIRARQILTLLKPRSVVGGSKVRVGRANDGGYVMLEHALNNVPVYSVGISNDVSWDLEMVKRRCQIFQYDHTIERLPVKHDNFRWEKFGIAGTTSADGRLLSMEDLLQRNKHTHKDNLILKLDVEGCEWDVLQKIASSTLAKFSQIVVELHCFDRLGTTADYESIYFGLYKLAETHQLVHVHANNCGWLCVLGGVPLPSAVEVTYVRRRDHSFELCRDVFPTPLDMPCRADVADIYLGPLGLLPDPFDQWGEAPHFRISDGSPPCFT